MKVMVLGATGMVGSAMVRVLREAGHEIVDTGPRDVLVNCMGIVPERGARGHQMVKVNAVAPHELAAYAEDTGHRLIHISTDCVFSGKRGMYTEDDTPDATDLYGRSKLCGEVGAPHLTLRTSIIGHGGKYGLVNWFMAQQGKSVPGYTNAFFSGVTNLELARFVRDYVLPNPSLQGLYHLANLRVSKCELLRWIAGAYDMDVSIIDHALPQPVDRSLDASKLERATGYFPRGWATQLHEMREQQLAGWFQ